MSLLKATRSDGSRFQVVDAGKRGDLCYANKKGIYWHNLDHQSGIDVSSVTGPFADYEEARNAAYRSTARPKKEA